MAAKVGTKWSEWGTTWAEAGSTILRTTYNIVLRAVPTNSYKPFPGMAAQNAASWLDGCLVPNEAQWKHWSYRHHMPNADQLHKKSCHNRLCDTETQRQTKQIIFCIVLKLLIYSPIPNTHPLLNLVHLSPTLRYYQWWKCVLLVCSGARINITLKSRTETSKPAQENFFPITPSCVAKSAKPHTGQWIWRD